MGNRNARQINKDTQKEGRQINEEGDRFDKYAYGRLGEAGQHANDIWNTNAGTYKDIIGGKYPGRSMAGGGGGGGGNLGQYEDWFRRFGGAEDKNRLRGGGVFDEYSKTGGFSEADKSDFMAQATGTVPKFYESIANELDRMKNVTGGAGPGYDAQMAKLVRDRTQAGQGAILDAKTGLRTLMDNNRRWGTEGMMNSENLLAQNQMQAMGQAGGFAGQRASMDQAERNAQRDDDYRWTFGALGGLQDMYGMAPGEEGQLMSNINQSRQLRGGLQGQNLDRRMAYNPNVSAFDRAMQLGQLGGSLAMSAFAPGSGFLRGGGSSASRMGGAGDFSDFTQGPQISNPFSQGGFGTNPFRRRG